MPQSKSQNVRQTSEAVVSDPKGVPLVKSSPAATYAEYLEWMALGKRHLPHRMPHRPSPLSLGMCSSPSLLNRCPLPGLRRVLLPLRLHPLLPRRQFPLGLLQAIMEVDDQILNSHFRQDVVGKDDEADQDHLTEYIEVDDEIIPWDGNQEQGEHAVIMEEENKEADEPQGLPGVSAASSSSPSPASPPPRAGAEQNRGAAPLNGNRVSPQSHGTTPTSSLQNRVQVNSGRRDPLGSLKVGNKRRRLENVIVDLADNISKKEASGELQRKSEERMMDMNLHIQRENRAFLANMMQIIMQANPKPKTD